MLAGGIDDYALWLNENFADYAHGAVADRQFIVVQAPQKRHLLDRRNPQRSPQPKCRQPARRIGVAVSS